MHGYYGLNVADHSEIVMLNLHKQTLACRYCGIGNSCELFFIRVIKEKRHDQNNDMMFFP
jgi:hypothetical protein